MGTRADFYIEKDEKLEWLGSVAWDGYDVYEASVDDKNEAYFIKHAKSKEDYLQALSNYAKERITRSGDWISPDEGWPWPWENSHTTDMAYVFIDGKLICYRWGCLIDEWYNNDAPQKDDRFPDMSSTANVKHAGFLIIKGDS